MFNSVLCRHYDDPSRWKVRFAPTTTLIINRLNPELLLIDDVLLCFHAFPRQDPFPDKMLVSRLFSRCYKTVTNFIDRDAADAAKSNQLDHPILAQWGFKICIATDIFSRVRLYLTEWKSIRFHVFYYSVDAKNGEFLESHLIDLFGDDKRCKKRTRIWRRTPILGSLARGHASPLLYVSNHWVFQPTPAQAGPSVLPLT